MGRELEALGIEREERRGEENLGEKSVLGFGDRREAEGAEQAMSERRSVRWKEMEDRDRGIEIKCICTLHLKYEMYYFCLYYK